MVVCSDIIIEKFAKNNLILTTHAFNAIIKNGIDIDLIIERAISERQWLITQEFIEEFVIKEEKVKGEIEKQKVEVIRPSKKIFSEEISSELKISNKKEISGNSTCSGKIEDFLEYFNQKYNNLASVIRERPNMAGTIQIKNLKKYPNENLSLIVMVREKRESKKGYKFLDVEDPTGELTILIPKENERLQEAYEGILLDTVIGVTGVFRNNLFIANDFVEPELPMVHQPKNAEEPVHLAFLSDIHVGSYLFLKKEFSKFIDWLNLKDNNNKEIAEKVKYIFIAGDLVDGIGIYPTQEYELSIPDIYKQYDYFAELLMEIPSYIEIVISVGNHDAVRSSEPQPKISKDIAPKLYDLENVHLVGNPAQVETHNVKTLIYHGTSLDNIISSLSYCSYSHPETAMIEYLKKRYLVPSYGNDLISPEKKDVLFIDDIPDILHCGHVHTNGYATYRGVRVINSGTFQGRTKYQEQLGHVPTPAVVPVINLQNFELHAIHFKNE
ncbi:MAG: DNA-directed DNA polymerase II small subunit [Candidatus Altiarchaeota archaeon]